MSPVMLLCHFGLSCFPRVSGDEPQLADRGIPIWKFSPRERG